MNAEAIVDRDNPAYRGQAGYTRASLKAYDSVGLPLALSIFWRCSFENLVDLYGENAADKHLDIGVAGGSLLDRATFPSDRPEITLMDLNPICLETAAKRIRRYEPRIYQANILKPWDLPDGAFGSVGMMNVLHCVPGNIEEKAVAFDHARRVLAPGGSLFGSTILAEGVHHTRRSRAALALMNRRGDFGNAEDRLDHLSKALSERFPEHRIQVEGAMALFVARVPA